MSVCPGVTTRFTLRGYEEPESRVRHGIQCTAAAAIKWLRMMLAMMKVVATAKGKAATATAIGMAARAMGIAARAMAGWRHGRGRRGGSRP